MTEHRDRRASSSASPLPLDETDRQVAGYVWLERRRFELLGGWAVSMGELEAKALLAVHARHHAWHASLWAEHLPRRSGHHGSGVAPADHGGLARCLADVAAEDRTIGRLVGAYRVAAPQATRGYADHLARASAISDAALARTCRLVLADQRDDLAEGEALIQSLLTTQAAVELADAYQDRLDRLLAGEAVGREKGGP